MIVVDASLVVHLLLAGPAGAAIRSQIDAAGREMAAPEVLDLEVLQTLRRFVHREQINTARATTALGAFEVMAIVRVSHETLRPRVWALRDNLTAYDAAYIALAEYLQAPLWTRDAKLRDAPGHAAQVSVL